MRLTDDEVLEAARKVQYETIKRWMLDRYVGDRARINKWSPFYYGISGFSANALNVGITTNQARKRLRSLANKGVIQIIKKDYGPVSFLFDREFCYECADKAIKYWQDQGYSQEELRPLKYGH